jgi:hypothetical protein
MACQFFAACSSHPSTSFGSNFHTCITNGPSILVTRNVGTMIWPKPCGSIHRAHMCPPFWTFHRLNRVIRILGSAPYCSERTYRWWRTCSRCG